MESRSEFFSTAVLTDDARVLILVGFCFVIALGSLVMPWIRPALRAFGRSVGYIIKRLWNMVVDELIKWIVLGLLALAGSAIWLADIAQLVGRLMGR